jgi:hypothetical protein
MNTVTKRLGTIVFICLGTFLVNAQNANNSGQIPPELVGKWCFLNLANGGTGTASETCITLNADGTYEFYLDGTGMTKANAFLPGNAFQERDSGTWWASDNTLYYNSSSHGEGSFQFQKVNQPHNESVAAIAVSGQYFVCMSTHDPW